VRDLRGVKKQRADRQARFAAMEERLRRKKQARAEAIPLAISSPERRGPSKQRSAPASPAPTASDACIGEDQSEEGNWFRIVHGRAILESSIDSAPESSRQRDGRSDSPPPSRSPVRRWGNPGDDVTCTEGIFVSI
jgi:hypothetical protein